MLQQDKHFHMSDDYEFNSSSQKSIGRFVIQCAVEMAKSEFGDTQKIKALDIACGPGNLTIEFLRALEDSFPGAKIELAGLDYSEMNVKRLVENSSGKVKGILGSFYKLPSEANGQNIIISNEGLHWQPPFKTSKIHYYYLDPGEKEKYESWALQNHKNALRNIYEAMQKEGIAVLQYGHTQQIKKIWDTIYKIFNENPFKEYMDKVNFPVYHPTIENVCTSLKEVGFADENINIKHYTEDLVEDTPLSITNFLRGFTQPGISQFLNPNMLEDFYKNFEDKLNGMEINEFRKNQMHRTLIKLKKR